MNLSRTLTAFALALALMFFAAAVFAADPPKLPEKAALKIANLVADRNMKIAEFHAARTQAALLDQLQRAADKAEADYRAAIEAEKTAAKLDKDCRLDNDNQTWRCPDKTTVPASTPAPEKEKEKK